MSSKKGSIIISLIIMAVSAVIFTILNFRMYTPCFREWMASLLSPTTLSDWKNYLVVISSGSLASSIVTLLICISEYRVERRKELENFADANFNFCADFYNMKYLNINMPIQLLKGYYADQWRYLPAHRQRNQSFDSENEVKIKAWIWTNTCEDTKERYNTDESKKKYLDCEFKHLIQKYDEGMDAVMKQYIDLSDKVSKRELTATIGGIDFLFGNKYRKEVLYQKMYARNTDVINEIQRTAYHFKEYYKADNGNKPVMLDFIQKIQDYLFLVTDKEDWQIVYNKYLFDINLEINSLLRKLYGEKRYHEKIPQIEDYEVVAYLKSLNQAGDDEQKG